DRIEPGDRNMTNRNSSTSSEPRRDDPVHQSPTVAIDLITDEQFKKSMIRLQELLHPNRFAAKHCSVCSRISDELTAIPLSEFNEAIYMLSNASPELQDLIPPTTTCLESGS
ncbi:hypothetical protein HDV02_006223, partial [Globomyces sp. JEL0801]